jgi:hypothetical protein
MATYEVETESGTYEIQIDGTLPEGPEGEKVLQRLVKQQLRQQQLPDPKDYPNDAQALLGIAKQVPGGVRDAGQSLLDLPTSIANVVSEFISPDPPGGPRRRMVPDVQSPQLPDVAPAKTPLERTVRFGSQLAADAAGSLLFPQVRQGASSLWQWLRPRPTGKNLMFEPGSVARDIAERRMRQSTLQEDLTTPPSPKTDINTGTVPPPAAKPRIRRTLLQGEETTTPRPTHDVDAGSMSREMPTEYVPTPKLEYDPKSPSSKGAKEGQGGPFTVRRAVRTRAEHTELLKTPPSEGAMNLSRLLLDFHATDIPKMSFERAVNARRRLLTKFPEVDLTTAGGPLQELWDRLTERLLIDR